MSRAPAAPGIDSALVLTGLSTQADADAADPRPTHVAASLAALVLALSVIAYRSRPS